MSEVKVLPVPEGSIVWLQDVEFPPEVLEKALAKLRAAAGHDRFVVLSTSSGSVVDVLGPDELVERVHAALATTTLAEAGGTPTPDLRTADGWQIETGIQVIEPEGWTVGAGALVPTDWSTLISRREFDARAALSVVADPDHR